MKGINIFFFLGLLTSCNSHDNKVESAESKQSSKPASSPIKCYTYAGKSDTVMLKVIRVGDSITGTLVYNIKEKDKNKGTIQGAMRDTLLIADYTFISEGVQSVRQVAFKLEGNTFIEGYGESLDDNGKIVFKNLDSLTFSSLIKLPETTCQ